MTRLASRNRRARPALLPGRRADSVGRRVRCAAARYDAIEARFPDLARSRASRSRSAPQPAGRFAKVRHAVPMLSLDNAFSEQDVVDFVARIRRFLRLSDDEKIAFSAEPKIDGLSMSLRYENGELVTRRTRGDGIRGRGRHRQRQDAEGRAAEAQGQGRARGVRGARRNLHDQGRVPGAQQAPESSGRHHLRQSAQFSRRLAAPEGPEHHRLAPARLLRLCLGRNERDAGRHAIRHDQVVRNRRLQHQSAHQDLPQRSTNCSPSTARSKRNDRTSTTTSTASSTRSTASIGRSGSASSRACRAGRSRTNSRPRRRPRWCATSKSRSAGPAC